MPKEVYFFSAMPVNKVRQGWEMDFKSSGDDVMHMNIAPFPSDQDFDSIAAASAAACRAAPQMLSKGIAKGAEAVALLIYKEGEKGANKLVAYAMYNRKILTGDEEVKILRITHEEAAKRARASLPGNLKT